VLYSQNNNLPSVLADMYTPLNCFNPVLEAATGDDYDPNFLTSPGVMACGPLAPFCTLNIETDFGAVPGNLGNDHQAFVNAAAFINAKPTNQVIVLEIPGGEYIVGNQIPGDMEIPTPATPNYLHGEHPFSLEGTNVNNRVSNVTIVGLNNGPMGARPLIRFNACMRYGVFDPVSGDKILVPNGLGANNTPDQQISVLCSVSVNVTT